MNASGAPWPAPAKLNLFLHILGRRPDGYHELQTCFQFVDLCDEITIGMPADGRIRRMVEMADIAEDADLCVRAARALQSAAGCPIGRRHQRAQAHTHGRRSWAAAVPMRPPAWWRSIACGNSTGPSTIWRRWASSWGRMCPCSSAGGRRGRKGIGERLTPLYPPLAPSEANYLILKPNIDVSTADVFQDPELTRNSAPITIHGFLASGGRNDCLSVVRRRYPEVARALDWLSRFGSARLTGTGACVFLACETTELRQEIVRQLPPGLQAFLARGLNDSPLLERLAAD